MNNKFYNVKNRSSSRVVYRIPEINIRREFMPGETKKIDHEELEKLSYRPGGENLISNYLQISDINAAAEFNAGRPLEPEYNYSEEDVRSLLINGSLDSLLDALDFAPAGVVELIKTIAVNLPLTDTQKAHAIKAKTGFDVATAIRHIEEEKQAMLDEMNAGQKQANVYDNGGSRRVSNDTTSSGRRAPVENKYKIVSRED